MISAIILTKNEEKNIERCFKSLLWCSEIIIIDDYSIDSTIKIAKKWGGQVFKRHLNNDFAEQRNFGLKKAKGEWILFVDADEIVSRELKREILNKVHIGSVLCGFYLKRRDYFLGKELKYGEIGNIKLLRLGRKNIGRWKRKVHEYWQINGIVGELENPLLHYPHQNFSEFIDDINKYSDIHAKELKKEGKKSNLIKVVIWPMGKFFVSYVLKLGFLDGVEGFIMAVMMSFHSFLSWSKSWMY